MIPADNCYVGQRFKKLKRNMKNQLKRHSKQPTSYLITKFYTWSCIWILSHCLTQCGMSKPNLIYTLYFMMTISAHVSVDLIQYLNLEIQAGKCISLDFKVDTMGLLQTYPDPWDVYCLFSFIYQYQCMLEVIL